MKRLPVLEESDAPAVHPSRREFMSAATYSLLATALAAACGGGGGDGGPTTPTGSNPGGTPGGAGIGFAGNVLTIPLSAAAGLAAANGFFISNSGSNDVRDANNRAADVIVLNLGDNTFRAFSSICTHERCTVADYRNGRITCPCHGSQFDNAGRNVSGPAPLPLTEYAVAFNATTRTVSVTKA
jgi:Rieske Fe-S protein